MQKHNENCFLIDWLTVTFKSDSVSSLQFKLGLLSVPWEYKTKFVNGYPQQAFFSNITIRYGADNPVFYSEENKKRDDMGICLDMSGKGCRSFETYSSISWFDLFDVIIQSGGNVTRLDLAYDDHVGALDIYRIANDVKDRYYVSKSIKSMIIWSDDQDEDIQGCTVEIGSKKSPVLIRIYDKAAERGYDHNRHWVRVECQLRHERSAEALQQLHNQESIGIVAAGILKNYLTFRVPSSDSNRCRWPIAEYWEKLLHDVEKISLWQAPGEEYNYSKSENHLVEQYGQMLQAYYMMHGGLSSLLHRSYKAHPVLKPKYMAAIQKYRYDEAIRREMRRAQMASWGFDLPDELPWSKEEQSDFTVLLTDDPNCPF